MAVENTIWILLAERDPYSAELTEHFLRTEGYSVELVFTPEHAMKAAAELSPGLAIVDLLISGVRGKLLCSQLREMTQRPVLAISSLASANTAFSVGASAFLQKPIEPVHLLSTVRHLLDHEPTPEQSGHE